METDEIMERTELANISGAWLAKRKVFKDDRGYFSELLRDDAKEFVQQNVSFNYGGTLRGMHFQTVNPQGKLVTCLYGQVLDVIFDLRKDSPTFGEGFSVYLDFEKLNSLYVPPGCAHGFLTTSRFAVLQYNCTTFYDPGSDGGVHWLSPEIKKFLPEDIVPTVSSKDRVLPSVSEYLKQIK